MKWCDLNLHTTRLFEIVFFVARRCSAVFFGQVVGCFCVDLLQVHALDEAANEKEFEQIMKVNKSEQTYNASSSLFLMLLSDFSICFLAKTL